MVAAKTGWYPANDGPFERFWDGAQWTEHTRPFTTTRTDTAASASSLSSVREAYRLREGETAKERNVRFNRWAMGSSGRWMWRHKIITSIAAVFLIGSCSAALSSPEGSESPRPLSGSEVSTSPTPESSESPAEELSGEDLWLANYGENEPQYLAAVARSLKTKKSSTELSEEALSTCRLIDKGRPLDKQVARVAKVFPAGPKPTYNQRLGVIGATVISVCPDLADVSLEQVSDRAAAIKKAKKVAAAKAAKARRQAARQAEAERRRKEREAQQNQPAPVYYANCSEVEAAGAAPIYRGQPGYSTSLDRDQDGVACEQ